MIRVTPEIPLTEAERAVLIDKDTEMPNTGRYNQFFERGIYACRLCGSPLFRSDDKFSCGCGWPAFDNEIKHAVTRFPDADGRRTEILCAHCGGHLGHVFANEKLTPNNIRHCVNSLSLHFESCDSPVIQRAFFAGGCFWGVEHLLMQEPGVLKVTSGYAGGHKDYPSYKEVCQDETGHAETVEVIFNPKKTTYDTLVKLFLEIHDPTQLNHQGPDKGSQYRSAIFYETEEQRQSTQKWIQVLKDKSMNVVTTLEPLTRFWPAESYHQNHYEREGTYPYCHIRVKRFDS